MTMSLRFGDDAGATLSPDRLYRYRLWRRWGGWGDPNLWCAFLMLNPSTADEAADDPTIRKCIGFAKRWGYGGVEIVNLFAWRSTDPGGLLKAADPIGPENDGMISNVCRFAHRVVLAWGRHDPRIQKLVSMRLATATWAPWLLVLQSCCTLGRTQEGIGEPRHPLMLPYRTRPERP